MIFKESESSRLSAGPSGENGLNESNRDTDRSVSYPFFSGYWRDEAFPQDTDLSPVPLFQDFPKMSHDLRQHKCTFTVCKIANPYIFD